MVEAQRTPEETRARDARIQAIARPSKALLTAYALYSLAGLFMAPVILVPLYFKYHTLRMRCST